MVVLPAAFGGGTARGCFCVRRFANRHDGFRPNVRPGYVTVFRGLFPGPYSTLRRHRCRLRDAKVPRT
jgi:hypothetical protein